MDGATAGENDRTVEERARWLAEVIQRAPHRELAYGAVVSWYADQRHAESSVRREIAQLADRSRVATRERRRDRVGAAVIVWQSARDHRVEVELALREAERLQLAPAERELERDVAFAWAIEAAAVRALELAYEDRQDNRGDRHMRAIARALEILEVEGHEVDHVLARAREAIAVLDGVTAGEGGNRRLVSAAGESPEVDRRQRRRWRRSAPRSPRHVIRPDDPQAN